MTEVPDEKHLEDTVKRRVEDLRWTKTAYFKMASVMKTISTGVNLALVLATGALAAVINQDVLGANGQLALAALSTTIALINLVFEFRQKAQEFEESGEDYNALMQEYENYYDLVLLDEGLSIGVKRKKLDDLNKEKRELDRSTSPTWDIIFKRIDEDDLGGTKEFDKIKKRTSRASEADS